MGLKNLSFAGQVLVFQGNALALFSAAMAAELLSADSFFVIENPARSYLSLLPAMLSLSVCHGVGFVHTAFKCYGTLFTKPLVLLTNMGTLTAMNLPVPDFPSLIALRGQTTWQGEKVFLTALFEAYPVQLGEHVAILTEKALDLKDQGVTAMVPAEDDRGNPMADAEDSDASMYWQQDPPSDDELNDDSHVDYGAVREVPRGGGAHSNMTMMDHWNWSTAHLKHPGHKSLGLDIPKVLHDNVHLLHDAPCVELDRQRAQFIKRISNLQTQLWPQSAAFLKTMPDSMHGIYSKLNVPLFCALNDLTSNPDDSVTHHLRCGFPLTGHLGGTCDGVQPGAWLGGLDVSELVEKLPEIRHTVLSKVVDYEHSEAVHLQTIKDAELGFMSYPVPLESLQSTTMLLTRRIPVEEIREGKTRVRVVDHCSESMLNSLGQGDTKMQNESIDWLMFMLITLASVGTTTATLWKRDISSAFRRCPVRFSELWLNWTCYSFKGVIYAACHKGCNFGCAQSVWAFHQVGQAITHILRELAGICVCRYVDDFFGIDKDGCSISAAECVDALLHLIGFPCDPKKSVTDVTTMQVLGVQVTLQDEFVELQVTSEKASRWAKDLHDIVQHVQVHLKDGQQDCWSVHISDQQQHGTIRKSLHQSFPCPDLQSNVQQCSQPMAPGVHNVVDAIPPKQAICCDSL
jgi:hypothetical protein